MVVITGATGNTGNEIARRLMAAGMPVRVIGRDRQKLKSLTDRGAEAAVGSLDDAGFLAQAFANAVAVYAMIPPNLQAADGRGHQNTIGRAMTEALQQSGVPHVVSLSSVGAHLPKDSGVVQGLYDFEQMLNEMNGLHVMHLRPTYFMENLFWQIGTVKQMKIMGSPIRGDLTFPMIATKDIAAYAAERLIKLDFSGYSHQNLLGPRDVTYQEVAGILGRAIGMDSLSYVQFPYEEARPAMIGMGMSPSIAEAFIVFQRALNDGRIMEDAHRDEKSSTATSIEEFAHTWAAVYNAQS